MATKNQSTQPIKKDVVTFVEPDEVITLPLGRPIDPTSERQKRLAEYDAKRELGLLHRGRPSDPSTVSYQRKAERAAKVEAGIELKRGRPVDPESPRQQMLARRKTRLAILQQQYAIQQQQALQTKVDLINALKAKSGIKSIPPKK